MVEFTLGAPVVAARAEADVKGWGPYQFPRLWRRADGGIRLSFHVAEDAMTAYGKDRSTAYMDYDAERNAWTPVQDGDDAFGYMTPGGRLIRAVNHAAFSLSSLHLPPPYAMVRANYDMNLSPYWEADALPKELDGFTYLLSDGQGEMKEKQIPREKIPGMLRRSRGGLLDRPRVEKLTVMPDGRLLWSGFVAMKDEERIMRHGIVVFESSDDGETFHYLSSIRFAPIPDPLHDPTAYLHEGYFEPMLAPLPDGSLMALMRTETAMPGALYQTRSTDGGRTWGPQTFFDYRGVWPIIKTLGNGVTVFSSGRPGLYLRGTDRQDGTGFGDRVQIVGPYPDGFEFTQEVCMRGGYPCMDMTCAYSDILPLSDDTFLYAYSDFYYPNERGQKVKTILSRVIRAKREE